MEALQSRIDSFSKGKRVKNSAKPSSHVNLKWPHPATFKANPDTLAEAGFYYNPSHDDPDNVTCYMCGKQLSDWEVHDDPFDIHWEKCGQQCCWANLRCGLRGDMDRHGRLVFPDKSRFPTSKLMEKARLETFGAGEGWIHDQTKNHGANSKKMARAGFVYTPQHAGDDLATCLYCNVSLSGWDEDDDPMEEHRKRRDKAGYLCPVFASGTLEASTSEIPQAAKQPTKAQSAKPPSKAKPASRSQSKNKHEDITMPTKTHDGDPDGEYDTSESARSSTATTAKTPRKPRSTSGSGASSARKSTAKTPRTKSRSTSRSGLRNVVEDDVVPPPTVKRSARSRSKSVALSEAEEAEEDVVPPATVKKKGRPRSKSVARSTQQEQSEIEEEEPAPPPTVKKKVAKLRSKSIARSERTEQSDADVEVEEEEPQKPSRSRAKAKAVEMTEDEELPRKSSRSKAKPQEEGAPVRKLARTKSKPRIAEDEESEPVVTTKPRTISKTKTAPPKSQVNAVPQASEDEFGPVIEQPHFAPAKSAKSRQKSKVIPHEEEPVINDDLGRYIPPPSSPPPLALEPDIQPELTPLIIPKRAAKPSSSQPIPDVKEKEVKEKKKPGRPPKAKSKTVVEEHPEEVQEESNQYAPLAPVSANPTPQSPTKDKSLAKSKEEVAKTRMKVVHVSSDEEDQSPREEKSFKLKVITQEGKENSRQFAALPVPLIQAGAQAREKKLSYSEDIQTKSTRGVDDLSYVNPMDLDNNDDVTMQLVGTDPVDVKMQDAAPQTPPRPTIKLSPRPAVTPPALEALEDLETDQQRPIMPPLSKLPFTPLNELTEAELDMTVEEWIRYQMEVEYDKFRRDGERELQRFRKQAEDVRKAIEGL